MGLVVLCLSAEVVDYSLENGSVWLSSTSVLRVVRLVRLVRVARIARALSHFALFRIFGVTISILADAVPITIIFSIIVGLIGMVFSIFFTDGATARVLSHGVDEQLIRYFGNFFVTMSTLQMAIFGGIDWEVAVEPLWQFPTSSIYVLAFYVYIGFCTLAMLNVLSAMFVEIMLSRAKNDRDYVVELEMESKREFLRTMHDLFEELDADGSGRISLPDLMTHIMDPKVNAFLRALDLNVFKVKDFFHLLDVNRTGDIDLSEFIFGCTRLRGEAKELDVAILQYEMKALTHEVRVAHELLSKFGKKCDQKCGASP